MLTEALDWRRDFCIDKRLREWRREWDEGASDRVRLLKRYDYIGLLGRDCEGLPVYIHRHSQGDLGGLVRELGSETLLLHMVRMIEDNLAEAQALMLKTGRFLCSFIEIHDIGNYGLVPHWLPRAFGAVPFFKAFAPVWDKVYPERVRLCMLLRGPSAFAVIWRLAMPLIPQATKGKIRLKGFAASSWLEEMQTVIPGPVIPAYLRSDDPAAFREAKPWGGIVPQGALGSKEALGNPGAA